MSHIKAKRNMSKPKTIDVFFKKIDISNSKFKTLVTTKFFFNAKCSTLMI